jgi:ADP-ribosylation factor protein 6
MGNKLSFWKSDKYVRVLICGLDNAGKTTMLSRILLGRVVPTLPSCGFQAQTLKHRHTKFMLWDVGGQLHLRFHWRHHFFGTHCVVFVVDASDASRFPEANQELTVLLAEAQLETAGFLILAHKCDVPGAVPASQLRSLLNLPASGHGSRPTHILDSSALTGAGLAGLCMCCSLNNCCFLFLFIRFRADALDWLTEQYQHL